MLAKFQMKLMDHDDFFGTSESSKHLVFFLRNGGIAVSEDEELSTCKRLQESL